MTPFNFLRTRKGAFCSQTSFWQNSRNLYTTTFTVYIVKLKWIKWLNLFFLITLFWQFVELISQRKWHHSTFPEQGKDLFVVRHVPSQYRTHPWSVPRLPFHLLSMWVSALRFLINAHSRIIKSKLVISKEFHVTSDSRFGSLIACQSGDSD